MGRRDEKKASKLRRLEAAGEQAFLEHGYAGATIDQIAAEADVARGTFYLYFKDKDALFAALVDRFMEPLVAAVKEGRDALGRCADTPSTFPIYAALGLQVAELLRSHASLVRLYLSESRSAGQGGAIIRKRTVRLERLTKEILEDAVRRGLLREHDSHVATHAILGAIERIAMQILRGDRAIDGNRVPFEIVVLFRQGLAPGA
jgi:TetR/AcrR family transcriptional regulator, fatty acid metabolism regulator protein